MAFMDTFGSVLRSPRQLGPTSRMPCRRTRAWSASSRFRPASPVSLNPAEITTSALIPFRTQASAVSRTCAAGTTITARSTSPGMDSTSG